MKCGSCRNTNAESYVKIKEDDNLFEILKFLNTERVFNPKYSYFCGDCINVAKVKLSHKLTVISNQNASISVSNPSTIVNNSDPSSDEYDMVIQSKRVYSDTGTPIVYVPPDRSLNKRTSTSTAQAKRPCPKRFKNAIVPHLEAPRQDARTIPEKSISQTQPQHSVISSQEVTSQEYQSSSEPMREADFLIGVENDPSSTSSSSGSQPLVEKQQQAASSRRSRRISNSLYSKDKPKQQTTKPSNDNSDKENSTTVETSHSEIILQESSESDVSPSHPEQQASYKETSKATEKPRLRRISKTAETLHPENISQDDSDSDVSPSHPEQQTSHKETSKATEKPRSKRTSKTAETPRSRIVYNDSDSDVSTSNQRTDEIAIPNQQTVGGPSAPAAKNPRIRQDNTSLTRDLRQYFSTNVIDVNNYSRTLAG